jgi:hypothetical protein
MRHIFVVGLDDEHLVQLRTLPGAEDYAFHAMFTHAQLKQADRFPVAQLLRDGPQILRAFSEHIAALIGYWDFPVSTVLPLLRAPLGLPGPSLEAVLRCEHKYWSRLCQQEVVPEYLPAFCSVDPFDTDPLSQVTLPMPFWLKPVKAVLSHLGFRIDNEADFDAAIARIRARIGRYAEPFNLILDLADLPPEVAGVDGHHCIAEGMISSGSQVTQEGWAHDGQVRIYGTIDSLRCGPTGSSFDRYQYPSRLPAEVLERMSAISERVIRHLGYTTAPFNIEYFWDPGADRIRLLEINTRISKSHAPLFYMVDGTYHHQVMVELGMGQAPAFVQGRGECSLAAKFMVRRFGDALVTRVPTAEEIARATAKVPHARVQIAVREGMRLSELRDQDSYSYEVAAVFIGADSPDELEANYRTCLDALPLEFEETS